MNVKDLIKILQELPENLPVIMSVDDEGNSYRFLNGDWVGVEGWNGVDDEVDIECGIYELTSELEEDGWSEEDVQPYKCVVIG